MAFLQVVRPPEAACLEEAHRWRCQGLTARCFRNGGVADGPINSLRSEANWSTFSSMLGQNGG
eukprot:818069-Alexandrium_andersonii.AAC.1